MNAYRENNITHRLLENYIRHQNMASGIDWSYHKLIPWERGRNFESDPWHPSQAYISPELALAVETAMLTELNLPWFTTGLWWLVSKEAEVLQSFVRTWTSEESQHERLLETYLLVTRNINPDRLHTLSKIVLRNAWTPGEATGFEGMVYTAIQELATQAFYVSVAVQADKEDPLLATMLRRIAKDETLHYVFYRDAVKAYLEYDPNRVETVCSILLSFGMPGFGMPDFHQRQQIISAGANYGIAEHFRKVVQVLMKEWDIKNLQPTYLAAQESQNRLNTYYDKMAKLAAANDRKKITPEALQRAQEEVRIAAAQLLEKEPVFEMTESGLLAPIIPQFSREK